MKLEEVAKQLEENNKQLDILDSLIKRNKRQTLINGFILGIIFYLILDWVL